MVTKFLDQFWKIIDVIVIFHIILPDLMILSSSVGDSKGDIRLMGLIPSNETSYSSYILSSGGGGDYH